MKRRKIISFYVGLIMMIVACTPESVNDNSLDDVLSSSSCSPPCWLGMTPGVTTLAEAQTQISSRKDIIDQESIFEYGQTEAYFKIIGWIATKSDVKGTLYFNDQYLDHITFRATSGKLKLSDAIEVFGIPDKVTYHMIQCPVMIGDGLCVGVTILFPLKDVQISFEQKSLDFDKIILTPDQLIDYVVYSNPQAHDSFFGSIKHEEERTFDWQGFTEIEVRKK